MARVYGKLYGDVAQGNDAFSADVGIGGIKQADGSHHGDLHVLYEVTVGAVAAGDDLALGMIPEGCRLLELTLLDVSGAGGALGQLALDDVVVNLGELIGAGELSVKIGTALGADDLVMVEYVQD